MTTPHEHLVHWLSDAYAMEKQALEMCERTAERIENYPELEARIAQHVQETESQIAQLDHCFEILGEKPSKVKSAGGWLMGNMQGLSGMVMPDEVVKASMFAYVFEHYEIASYTILVAAAEKAGEPEIAQICRDICEQEVAMADWLKNHLQDTSVMFLDRDQHDQRARA